MAKHEFGIIEHFEENRWYSSYEPEKYNCISVSDSIMWELTGEYENELMKIKTYFVTSAQPGKGLEYCGVTIFPPESLEQFRNVIIKANEKFMSKELELLIEKINQAITENKHLIHFGI